MTRIEKWNYAIELLEQNNIQPSDKRLTMNNYGKIVIHSKQLRNCLIIRPQATKKTIKAQVEMQVKIAKNYAA